MRPLELTLVVLNLLIIAAFVVSRQRLTLIAVLIALTMPVIAAHLLTEGYRWQMLPIYALTLFAAGLVTAGMLNGTVRTSMLIPYGVLLGIGVVALVLLPVPILPAPTGPYAIGTFTLTWQDDSRRGVYAVDPDEPRRL